MSETVLESMYMKSVSRYLSFLQSRNQFRLDVVQDFLPNVDHISYDGIQGEFLLTFLRNKQKPVVRVPRDLTIPKLTTT